MTYDNEGFSVDLDALGRAERGIDAATSGMAQLIPLNGTVLASWGIGLSDSLDQYDGTVLGHDELATALQEFGKRWDSGIGGLLREGSSAQQQLRASLETYQRTDAHIEEQLKRIAAGRQGRGTCGHE